MNHELTKHARKVLEERGIHVEWVERTWPPPNSCFQTREIPWWNDFSGESRSVQDVFCELP